MARQRFSDEEDDRDDDRRRDDRRDDDADDRPRRRARRDDDDYEDDRPRGNKKPGLATAAGVLWVISGSLGAIIFLANVYFLFLSPATHAANVALFGETNAGTMKVVSVFQAALVLVGVVLFLLAGVRALGGGAASLGLYGGLTIGYCVVYLIVAIGAGFYQASLMEEAMGRMGGPRAPAGVMSGAGIVGGICGGLIVITLPVLAGIFALSCNTKYKAWWSRVKGGRAKSRDEDDERGRFDD